MKSDINDLQDILEVIHKLKEKYIIVEGKKDEKVLQNFGLDNIIKIGGKNLHNIILTIKHDKEIVILTDFDKAGRKLAARTNRIFRKHKYKINNRLRKLFMNLGKSRIEDFKPLSLQNLL